MRIEFQSSSSNNFADELLRPYVENSPLLREYGRVIHNLRLGLEWLNLRNLMHLTECSPCLYQLAPFIEEIFAPISRIGFVANNVGQGLSANSMCGAGLFAGTFFWKVERNQCALIAHRFNTAAIDLRYLSPQTVTFRCCKM